MFLTKHKAVVAGLAAVLSLGTVSAPKIVSAATHAEDGADGADTAGGPDNSAATDEAAADGTLPEPASWDRDEEYAAEDEGALTALTSLFSSRAQARISPMSLSAEMKYFAQNESGSNYDLGFSSGDGYNAMGYYQFDRRYSLLPFMEQVYSYNPTKYSMFKAVIDRGGELKTGAIYDSSTNRLTSIGQLAQDAWHAAYAADPAEFSALQDAYGYQNYCVPALDAVESVSGVDISGRSDAVKGLAWSMTNLFGSGGVRSFIRDAHLTSSMTDRQIADALCNSVVSYYTTGEGKTHDYAWSYAARYERERKTVLSYISQHEAEAEQQKPSVPETPSTPEAPDTPEQPSEPETPSTPEQPGTDDNGNGGGSDSDQGNQGGSDSGKDDAGADDPSTPGDGSGSTDEGAGDAGNGGSEGSGDADADDGSDTEDGTGAAITAISIEDDAQPKGLKRSYTVGEAFDPTGLTLTATMQDGSTRTIAYGSSTDADAVGVDDQFSFSIEPGAKLTEAGEQTVTVTYTPVAKSTAAFTATYTITVAEAEAGDAGEDQGPEAAASYTVTFTADGKTFATQEVKAGKMVGEPSDKPTYAGYTFAGWYLNGAPYDFSTPVTGDIELVAYFKKAVTGGELPQTGDPATVAMMGAAGLTLAGGSLAAFGAQRRRRAESRD